MNVRDLMSRDVQTIEAADTLHHAAQRMRDLDVGPLPVLERGQLVGMLTDRDIVVRVVAEGRDPRSVPVRDAMTADVFFCFEDESLEQAAQVMESRQIRRLVVLDRDRNIAGILALADLARGDAGGAIVNDLVEEISQPVQEARNPNAGRTIETLDLPRTTI